MREMFSADCWGTQQCTWGTQDCRFPGCSSFGGSLSHSSQMSRNGKNVVKDGGGEHFGTGNS